jgi:hypothetical protein
VKTLLVPHHWVPLKHLRVQACRPATFEHAIQLVQKGNMPQREVDSAVAIRSVSHFPITLAMQQGRSFRKAKGIQKYFEKMIRIPTMSIWRTQRSQLGCCTQ